MSKNNRTTKKLAQKFIKIKTQLGGPAQNITFSDALHLSQQLCQANSSFSNAKLVISQLIAISPDNIDVLLMQCHVFMAEFRNTEVLKLSEKILKNEPRNVFALNFSAQALMYLNKNEQAIKKLKLAIRIKPHSIQSKRLLAKAFSYIGNKEKAILIYDNILKLNQENCETYYDKAYITNGVLSEADIDNLGNLAKTPLPDVISQAQVEFSLAKVCSANGDIKEEFYHLNRANQLMASIRPWNYAQEKKYFQYMKSSVDQELITKIGARNNHLQPIFIACMPRSGSTLINQAISAHRDVFSCGESGAFSAAKRSEIENHSHNGDIFNHQNNQQIIEAFSRLAEKTEQNFRSFSFTEPFFTDKSISNITDLGTLLLLFPNARVIEITRHPLDVILSAYKLMFSPGQNSSYCLEASAKNYQLHQDLMAHWKHLFASRIHTVSYEQLVSSQHKTTADILDFIGLPWDDACIKSHQDRAPVATPSSDQVRQPMHQNSIDRWKPYQAFLGPAIRQLE